MQHKQVKPRVWAIGGGKGGIGKSVISINLGVALARKGHRCVLVDADLGGANLHTMAGIPNPGKSLRELFTKDAGNLSDVLIPTGINNLGLISGAHALLDIANPKHLLKQKIIRQLFTLDADVVLLDLSAGSSFNVLDFFLAAHEPITVVVPTPTSIENAYHFLKAAFYRRLKTAIAEAEVGHLVDQAKEQKVALGIRTPREFLQHLAETSPEAGAAVSEKMAVFRPKLIVNQVRRPEEIALGTKMSTACRGYFGVEMNFLGGIYNDDKVVLSIQTRKPAMKAYPQSSFANEINDIMANLLANKVEGGRV
ncbi:MAG: P-loop NTPase [Nitrospinae bacterium]|nr:P-loop NTPase [Nitrospinota bacterium]